MEMKIDILRLLCEKDVTQTYLSEKLQINQKTIKPCLLLLQKNGLIFRDWLNVCITTRGREIAGLAKQIEGALGGNP
jgi:predicted transcriptional regulator